MATFPTLPITKISRKTNKPLIKQSYGGGYEQQRLKNTRNIKEFSLTFSVLTQAEAQTLENFFDANQGFAFDFYDAVFATTHQVRFTSDSISFNQDMPRYFSTSLTLKEV